MAPDSADEILAIVARGVLDVAAIPAKKGSYGRQYSDVWTKEPHGGAYVQATGNTDGYDALVERPSGVPIRIEPGYERPASGPTTNFVGNHMTQGAIDIVQSSLAREDPSILLRQDRLRMIRGREPPQPPKLIGIGPPPAVLAPISPVQTYSWFDEGARVVVWVPLSPLEDARGRGHQPARSGYAWARVNWFARVEGENSACRELSEPLGRAYDAQCTFGDQGLRLVVIVGLGAKHVLEFSNLFGPIVPGASVLLGAPDCGRLVIQLEKAGEAMQWPTLEAAKSSELERLERSNQTSLSPTPETLASLRRQVIVNREGRLAPALKAERL